MNKKKDRQYFVKEATDICFEAGVLRHVKDNFSTVFENDKLTVTIHPEEHHKFLYSVFMRFKTPCNKGGKISGKYNFYSTEDVKTAVADFEDHLKDALCTS